MRAIIIVVLTLLTIQSVSQTYDSLLFNRYERKMNLIDELGRKQGNWLNYKIKACKYDSIVLSQYPYQTFVSMVSKGEYLNDQRIGIWEYYIDNIDPCSEGCKIIIPKKIKTVHYSCDSVTIIGHDANWPYPGTSFKIITNKDSSFLKAIVNDINGLLVGTCQKAKSSDTTTCRLLGGKNRDFIRNEYIFKSTIEAFEFIECGHFCWY